MPKSGSAQIFYLIKSLSGSEKRYFKLFCSMHISSRKNNYARLFDVIEKQAVYNEAEIKIIFQNEQFIRRLDLVKSRLFEMILNSLELYHANASLELQLKKELMHVELLFQKGLFESCEKIVKKLKRLAAKHERHIDLIEIEDWIKKISMAQASIVPVSGEKIKCDEEIKISVQLSNIYRYKNLNIQLFEMINKKKDVKEITKLIKNDLLTDENRADSFRAKRLYYNFYIFYYNFSKNYEGYYQANKKKISLIENHSFFINDAPWDYLDTLNNMIDASIYTNRYDEVLPNIKKMRMISSRPAFNKRMDVQSKAFTLSYTLEILFYINTAQFQKAILIIPVLQKGMMKFEKKVSRENSGVLNYLISVVFFAVEQYKDSLAHLNKIIHSKDNASFSKYISALFLNIIVHYELGNRESVPYFAETLKRELKKNKTFGEQEKIILTYFKKLCKLPSDKELLSVFREFKLTLEKSINDNVSSVIDDFDILAWLEGKVKNISYHTIVKKKIRGKVRDV